MSTGERSCPPSTIAAYIHRFRTSPPSRAEDRPRPSNDAGFWWKPQRQYEIQQKTQHHHDIHQHSFAHQTFSVADDIQQLNAADHPIKEADVDVTPTVRTAAVLQSKIVSSNAFDLSSDPLSLRWKSGLSEPQFQAIRNTESADLFDENECDLEENAFDTLKTLADDEQSHVRAYAPEPLPPPPPPPQQQLPVIDLSTSPVFHMQITSALTHADASAQTAASMPTSILTRAPATSALRHLAISSSNALSSVQHTSASSRSLSRTSSSVSVDVTSYDHSPTQHTSWEHSLITSPLASSSTPSMLTDQLHSYHNNTAIIMTRFVTESNEYPAMTTHSATDQAPIKLVDVTNNDPTSAYLQTRYQQDIIIHSNQPLQEEKQSLYPPIPSLSTPASVLTMNTDNDISTATVTTPCTVPQPIHMPSALMSSQEQRHVPLTLRQDPVANVTPLTPSSTNFLFSSATLISPTDARQPHYVPAHIKSPPRSTSLLDNIVDMQIPTQHYDADDDDIRTPTSPSSLTSDDLQVHSPRRKSPVTGASAHISQPISNSADVLVLSPRPSTTPSTVPTLLSPLITPQGRSHDRANKTTPKSSAPHLDALTSDFPLTSTPSVSSMPTPLPPPAPVTTTASRIVTPTHSQRISPSPQQTVFSGATRLQAASADSIKSVQPPPTPTAAGRVSPSPMLSRVEHSEVWRQQLIELLVAARDELGIDLADIQSDFKLEIINKRMKEAQRLAEES